jgi:hypothetical protein
METENGTTFHFNGDYSGDVRIVVPVENSELIRKLYAGGTVEIKVPFEDLAKLVASKIRDDLISRVEQMSDDELLLKRSLTFR